MNSQAIRGSMFGAVLVGIGVVLGAYVVAPGAKVSTDGSMLKFEETLLHAASASSGDNFALATGAIDNEAEGVFVLDYATGDLKCAVLNQRTGKFAALFTANVTKELGASKNPKYEMVTGLVDFNRGTTPRRPAMSVVYVLDANSGKLMAYGIPWRREGSGRTQMGELKPIDGMQVRALAARRQ